MTQSPFQEALVSFSFFLFLLFASHCEREEGTKEQKRQEDRAVTVQDQMLASSAQPPA